MQCPLPSVPRNTLNPNVVFPTIGVRSPGPGVPGALSAGSGSGCGGSMRPPPVNLAAGHGGGATQKLGRFGAMLTFGWSVHAAASSPAAMRLGQTIRILCSRIMCVLPSSLSTILTSADQRAVNAKPMPFGRGGEPVQVSRHTEDVAASRRCARSDFACAVVACARVALAQQGDEEGICEQNDRGCAGRRGGRRAVRPPAGATSSIHPPPRLCALWNDSVRLTHGFSPHRAEPESPPR